MKLKGIDVSHHQGVIDWNKVKSQIDYAILSVGYGDDIKSQDDKQFHRNAKECTRLGIPFGVYIYSYAQNIQQAESEARHTLRMIKGYKLSYPVYYDLEDAGTTGKCTNTQIAHIADTFASIIEGMGYWCGIYANTSWFTNKLTNAKFNKWVKWVAQYAPKCTYSGKHDMWQYASDGRVNGVSGNVDVNYCYVDYPSMIRPKVVAKPKPTPKPEVKEFTHRNVIVYNNGATADKASAEYFAMILNNKGEDCKALDYKTYKEGKITGRSVFAVGGSLKDKFKYHKIFMGANRYKTAQEMHKHLKIKY